MFQDKGGGTMIITARNALLLAALSTTWACSSGNAPVDIGDGRTGERLQDYAAHWQGYAEAHDFSDGSDQVTITLDALGNGTLEIGDSSALAQASDPSVGYPLGVDLSHTEFELLVPGFSYPTSRATVESTRIRLSVHPWAIERDWCALQTAYANPEASTPYSCLPKSWAQVGGPGSNQCAFIVGNTVSDEPVDCNKALLCEVICECDAQ